MEIDSNSCNVSEKWARDHMMTGKLIVCTFSSLHLLDKHHYFTNFGFISPSQELEVV